MSELSWRDLSEVLTPQAFPIEVFGYAEDGDDEIIYHVVLASKYDRSAVPPLPKRRMRMKIVLATGQVLTGTEVSVDE